MRAWEREHQAGRTDAVTGRFFTQKPTEELYDTRKDPDNVVDLATLPEQRQRLAEMRAQLRRWQLEVRDSGLLPEGERARRAAAQGLTIYEMVRRPELYPLEKYLDAKDLALGRDPASRPALEGLTRDADAGLRYWGAYGLLLLAARDCTGTGGKPEAESEAALGALLEDACPEVRATAAWALLRGPLSAKAQEALRSVLKADAAAALYALNILDWAGAEVGAFADLFEGLLASQDPVYSGYLKRMVTLFRESGEARPPRTALHP